MWGCGIVDIQPGACFYIPEGLDKEKRGPCVGNKDNKLGLKALPLGQTPGAQIPVPLHTSW